ncbi:MAG: hypothetical protein ACKVW3_03205 [Phycisphaerales bacterium]
MSSTALGQIGPIVMWETPPFDQVPGSTTNYIMVAAGGDPAVSMGGHTLGLLGSTRLLNGWGGNTYGQTGVPPPTVPILSVPPDPNLPTWKLKAISAGVLHSLAIRDEPSNPQLDDLVLAWGANLATQCNIPISGLKAYAVSAGETFSVALRKTPNDTDLDRTLVAWGSAIFGVNNPQYGSRRFVSVSAGSEIGVALDTEGHLFAWGRNDANTNFAITAANVTWANKKFVAVECGDSHWIAILSDGTLVHGGFNGDGQNNVPGNGFHSIASGGWHCFAWHYPSEGGGLELWGLNDEGQLNVPANRGPFSTGDGSFVHSAAIEADLCYANCDGSRTLPILDANDFACFAARYANNDPYANCDGNTTPPLLTVNDYFCFANKFACGCEYVVDVPACDP